MENIAILMFAGNASLETSSNKKKLEEKVALIQYRSLDKKDKNNVCKEKHQMDGED